MSILQIIGACMLIIPFLALLTFVALVIGWVPVVIVLFVVAWLYLAAFLLVEGGE